MPDTVVSDSVRNLFLEELNRKSMIFKYANHFALEKRTISDTFQVTNAIIDDFESFLKEKGFEYQDEGEAKLKELRTLAASARYDQTFLDGVDKLENELKAARGKHVHRYQEDIRTALKTEILARMKGDKARFESTFAADKQLQTAISILKNKKVYDKLLGLKGK
jgi:carboxyl-terminal processing protease